MKEEDNLLVAHDVLEEYLWWHKEASLGGLSKISKLSSTILNDIRYNNIDTLSDSKLAALKNGIEIIKDKTIMSLEIMLEKLESQK